MNLDEFIEKFAAQFDDTEEELFSPNCVYKELEEWSSLVAMCVVALVKTEFGKTITASEIRNCNTIEDLYNHIISM